MLSWFCGLTVRRTALFVFRLLLVCYKIHCIMTQEKSHKVVTLVLEIVKAVISMLIGYFGGNAIV